MSPAGPADMHETIRILYEGTLDASAWRRSLARLRDASGSAYASIVTVSRAHGRLRTNVLAHTGTDLTDGPANAPPDEFNAPEPEWARTAKLATGQWYIGMNRAGMAHARRQLDVPTDDTRAANDAGVGQSPVMLCLVDRGTDHETYLCLLRTPDQLPYVSRDAHALDWAIPHVRQAAALRRRASLDTLAGRASTGVIDRLPFAVAVVRNDGELLQANQAGEAWVRRLLPRVGGAGQVPSLAALEAPPTGSGGNHGLHGWRLSRGFADVLHTVCDPQVPMPAQAMLAHGVDGRTAQIVTMPLWPDAETPAALVVVYEGNASPPAMAAILRDLYALTPAEARLAALMTTGIGLPEACAQLGIKRETSRTQLKSIFIKTGMSTQAQLSHLLTRLASVLASHTGVPPHLQAGRQTSRRNAV
ncbi:MULTISPECIES: helix-turn-helix transcriptional regulator [unclassified Cupriavidus]|uniref:helix-turn-helix transcriptional regulator n=1 Tax=Cupriavidus sp. H19C3 TaxID=3241603 RepID=UPI003BF82B8E